MATLRACQGVASVILAHLFCRLPAALQRPHNSPSLSVLISSATHPPCNVWSRPSRSRSVLPMPPPTSSSHKRCPLAKAVAQGASVVYSVQSSSQLCRGGVISPVFQMMNPRFKDICSFFPRSHFKVDMGFDPGAGQLLPAVAVVPRGGTTETCCPKNACLTAPPPASAKELFLAPALVPRAPALVPRAPAMPVTLHSQFRWLHRLALHLGVCVNPVKMVRDVGILFHLLFCKMVVGSPG